MLNEPINIFLISFKFSDTLPHVINSIKKNIKYPNRIIIGDNLSNNSRKIRNMLRSFVDEGRIYSAYFYPTNSKTKIIKHMVYSEMELNNGHFPEYTVFSDGDALIKHIDDSCWLTDFISKMQLNPKIGIVGYQNKNTSIKRSRAGVKIEPDFISPSGAKSKFIEYSSESISSDSPCPIRAHYLLSRTHTLLDFWTEFEQDDIYDGQYQRYLGNLGYSASKYINGFTYNLGTIKAGYVMDLLDKRFKLDRAYNKLRHTNWKNCEYPSKYERIEKIRK